MKLLYVFILSVVVTVLLSLVFLRSTMVYCIMVTGKDPSREAYARKSVQNFLEQDYRRKRLVIINHGTYQVLDRKDDPQMFEFHVEKGAMTLGDLRNIALNLVPTDAIWTVWDDDDIRSSSYLSRMYYALRISGCDMVAICNRYECNVNTGFVWKIRQLKGLPTVFCKQDLRVTYLPEDTMEDVHLIRDYRARGHPVYLWSWNDPAMYIRVVHSTNTSLYVNREKATVTRSEGGGGGSYTEAEVTKAEQAFVKQKVIGAEYK
jgi:hypothetical protein